MRGMKPLRSYGDPQSYRHTSDKALDGLPDSTIAELERAGLIYWDGRHWRHTGRSRSRPMGGY